MSQLGDYVRTILAGGLPAVLDTGRQGSTAQGDTRPEQTAPAGTHVDNDTAKPTVQAVNLDWKKGLLIGGCVVGALAILYAGMRFAGRRG